MELSIFKCFYFIDIQCSIYVLTYVHMLLLYTLEGSWTIAINKIVVLFSNVSSFYKIDSKLFNELIKVLGTIFINIKRPLNPLQCSYVRFQVN